MANKIDKLLLAGIPYFNSKLAYFLLISIELNKEKCLSCSNDSTSSLNWLSKPTGNNDFLTVTCNWYNLIRSTTNIAQINFDILRKFNSLYFPSWTIQTTRRRQIAGNLHFTHKTTILWALCSIPCCMAFLVYVIGSTDGQILCHMQFPFSCYSR